MYNFYWYILFKLSLFKAKFFKLNPLSVTNSAERGQGMAEYALIIAFVSIAAIITMGLLGDEIADIYGKLNCEFPRGTYDPVTNTCTLN